ncbi:MAG: hypothetical protein QG623_104, partial [Patescibacteria group bacterium]|nr:hypothetical protein [Patescibacteria group bacterium]
EQAGLISQRIEAKKVRDFAESDRIRDLLNEQGIEVRDTDNGQIWSRV